MMKMGMNSESPLIVTGPRLKPPRASATPSATPRMITGNDQSTSSRNLITPSTGPRR
jgi:hypothetical protein